MTKLIQWLIGLVLLSSVYAGLLLDVTPFHLTPHSREVVIMLPVYLLIAFACFSLAVIGYRVATFNDCTEAAEELKLQIKQAKADLKSKGFVS